MDNMEHTKTPLYVTFLIASKLIRAAKYKCQNIKSYGQELFCFKLQKAES